MVGLIVAILVGAVILLLLYSGNVISSFNEEFSLMITTLSSYFRIALVSIANTLITIVATILLVIYFFKIVTGSVGTASTANTLSQLAEKIGGVSLRFTAKAFALPSGSIITGIVAFIAFLLVATTVLPAIPLYAPHININIGTTLHPEDNTTYVAGVIAEKVDNTWKAFGSGSGNPLEGIKNPILYYTIFVHLKDDKTLTLSDVDQVLKTKYHRNYQIYVFCANSKGIVGSTNYKQQLNPFCWNNAECTDGHTINTYGASCQIKDGSEVKIYYLDHMDTFNPYVNLYSISEPYGCPYVHGVGGFDKDSIIICVT